MTPCAAKRGISAARRCWACSIRKRRSLRAVAPGYPLVEVEDLRVGAVADRVDLDLESRRASAPATRSSNRESGIASAAHTPLLVGSSVKGSKRRAVAAPSAPSENPLTPPMRQPLVVSHGRPAVPGFFPLRERRPEADPHGQLAGVAQLLPGVEGSGVALEILNGGHPDARRLLHGGAEGLGKLRRRARRPDGGDGVHGGVFEKAGRLSGGVAHDDAARRVGRAARDLRELQGQAVADHHVAILPREAGRVVARRRIEQGLRRKPRRRPLRVIPGSVGQPDTRRLSLRVGRDLPREVGLVLRPPQVESEQVQPAHRHVRVRVDEAGDDAPASGVEDDGLRSLELRDLGVGPDGEDPPATDGQGLRLRARRITRPDPGGEDDQVRNGRRRGGRRNHQSQRQRSDHAVDETPLPSDMAARAAARRATGTR